MCREFVENRCTGRGSKPSGQPSRPTSKASQSQGTGASVLGDPYIVQGGSRFIAVRVPVAVRFIPQGCSYSSVRTPQGTLLPVAVRSGLSCAVR